MTPALAYFHIPIPEYNAAFMNPSMVVGEKQEVINSASVNSGLFTSLVEAGDVKATFVGHDHVNDYCGSLLDINLCFGGGIGYHTYGYVLSASRDEVHNYYCQFLVLLPLGWGFCHFFSMFDLPRLCFSFVLQEGWMAEKGTRGAGLSRKGWGKGWDLKDHTRDCHMETERR